MKNTQKLALSGTALAALLIISSPNAADAFNKGYQDNEDKQARFEEFKATLSSDQQEVLAEVKALHEEGKHEEARELFKNSDIERPDKKFGKDDKKRKKPLKKNPELKEYIESDDYDGFVEAIGDSPFAQKITEDMFDTFVEIHELKEDGDHDAAKELMKELRSKKQLERQNQ